MRVEPGIPKAEDYRICVEIYLTPGEMERLGHYTSEVEDTVLSPGGCVLARRLFKGILNVFHGVSMND